MIYDCFFEADHDEDDDNTNDHEKLSHCKRR